MPLTSSLPSAVQLLKLPLSTDLFDLTVTATPAPARSRDSDHRRYAPCDQIARSHPDNWTQYDPDQQAVIDFLVALAKAALRSSRRHLLFLTPNGNAIADTVAGCLHSPGGRLPSVQNAFNTNDITRTSNASMQKGVLNSSGDKYRLLQGVISSSPCHIVKLPPSRQVSAMGTPHQFLLVKNPPGQESEFQRAKAQHGSVFAFHGSRLENWHSILAQGLMVGSQTALQVNGNHYGNGVYLSPYPRVAWLYSAHSSETGGKEQKKGRKTGVSGGGSLLDAKVLSCLALCEVVNCDSLSKRCDTQWVCRNSDHVSVTLLFVYESSSVLDGPPLSFPVDHFMESVKRAVAYGTEARSHY